MSRIDLNRWVGAGNLTKDPISGSTTKGTAYCNFSIGCNSRNGVSFFDITVFGKLAEVCNEYLTKGRQIFLEGRLQQDTYTDKGGNRVSKLKIVADNVQFVGSKNSNEEAKPSEFRHEYSEHDEDISF